VWEDQHVRAENEEDAQDIVLTLRIFTKVPLLLTLSGSVQCCEPAHCTYKKADVRTIPSNPARVATRVWKISILASLPLQNHTALVNRAVRCCVYQFFRVFFVRSDFL
jgi:hypothetical protein